MREHGEMVTVNFGVKLPVNVCKNSNCGQEFILLKVRHDDDVWEQVGNGMGLLHCPYCAEKVGIK